MIDTLLLDRDGVLIPEREYDYAIGNTVLMPGVIEGLKALESCSFFIVSNQSGIGRGYFSAEEAEAVNGHVCLLLRNEGIIIRDVAYCPHLPEEGCRCRKPATGMWEDLAGKHGLVVERTAVVGNRGTDVAFARNIGCTAILVQSDDPRLEEQEPDYVIENLGGLAGILSPHTK